MAAAPDEATTSQSSHAPQWVSTRANLPACYYNVPMEMPAFVIYLSAGAYIAIMIAVLGVPQMLSSYFDVKARRLERQENEANTERRHQESLAAQIRRDEREEERRREERRTEEERRRHESDMAERRHQELMALLIAALGNRNGPDNGQSETVQSLQRTIDDLRAENERLRQRNGNGSSDQ